MPERVSQDFVKTILKVPGGSGDQITTFLRKIGLANPDGSPSDLYKSFRNPSRSGRAIASAIRVAYAPLYVRNEFMHELPDDALVGLITEETGQPHDAGPVKLIAASIRHLKTFADFKSDSEETVVPLPRLPEAPRPSSQPAESPHATRNVGLNLGYTINLNLPASTDPAVFDAIFRSLKEHLLRAEDA